MPRSTIHLDLSVDDVDDPDDIDDTDDTDDHPQFQKFRSGRRSAGTPRLALEGKSGRRAVEAADEVDLDQAGTAHPVDAPLDGAVDAPGPLSGAEPLRYSSYDASMHGPEPIPAWVITSSAAVDLPLGILKTGKEADVHLLDRSIPGGQTSLLAVKTYRSSDHRMFHRDSGYQEGRRVRRSRESRAMAARTVFGKELLAGKWAMAEFEALGRLWNAGANVPYPVQLIGSELMMEFVGDGRGRAAPRLAAATAGGDPVRFFTGLWNDLLDTLFLMADLGLTHGDLSPYNVLVRDGRCVLIDLPQVVDVIGNPQGVDFLARDVRNVCDFFGRRGVAGADPDQVTAELVSRSGLGHLI